MLIWLRRSFTPNQANLLVSTSNYSFAAYRTNEQQQMRRGRKDFFNVANPKLFKSDPKNPDQQSKLTKRSSQNDTNVQQFVKTINQINKDFLGIKLNTDYFKTYNQKSFSDICKPAKVQSFKIHDLPFAVKSSKAKTGDIQQIQQEPSTELPNNAAVKMLRSMISEEKLLKELQKLVKTYFSDLLSKQRDSRMQVNFQSEARKVIQTLKASKWSFRLTNKDATPKVVLKNVTILKGVQVNRNINYTVDSYKTDSDESNEGIITYTLFKKAREQYPEAEWFAQKFIVARIQAEVSQAPVIDVVEQNSTQSSSKGITHSFVFEADLTVPPSLSILSLTPQQHLKSYRLKPENIYITNVDKKNIWFNLAYKEEDKKYKLINKII